MATVDQGSRQRGDEERPQAVLLKEAVYPRNSCWVVVFALIVYQTCNGVKRALSLAPRTEKNSLWLMSADARLAIFSF